jgi:antitoxin ChpS
MRRRSAAGWRSKDLEIFRNCRFTGTRLDSLKGRSEQRDALLYFRITFVHDHHNMHHTSLRKVGGSVMLTIPRPLLDQLELEAGARVDLAISEGRLVVEPARKPKYTLAELLAASDYAEVTPADEDRVWIDAPAAGREIL